MHASNNYDLTRKQFQRFLSLLKYINNNNIQNEFVLSIRTQVTSRALKKLHRWIYVE